MKKTYSSRCKKSKRMTKLKMKKNLKKRLKTSTFPTMIKDIMSKISRMKRKKY